ncbi:cytochrome P450 [Friedmanniella endophytica]|uniref:Cytochrome P450 n=1 Tax=Microlunatus kandeliicorticis TaxID=1759536 RepID=A0A7W3IQN1_9ACTN|nr:cytochrome P450 [Microlunatus kandeliicorticis]MBA8793430.1 cytochrome P450 [Microlunatus kandeliicorticis]
MSTSTASTTDSSSETGGAAPGRRPTPPLFRRGEDFAPQLGDAAVERIQGPFGEPVWAITTWADGRAVLSDAERFSREQLDLQGVDSPEERRRIRAGNMLTLDPPDHTRLRRAVTAEFTVKRIRNLRPRIEQIVDDHLDRMEAHGSPVDLTDAFAPAIPSLVICELLGVPYADRHDFQSRAATIIDFTLPMETRRQVSLEMRTYMRELVQQHRRDPGDDLLGRLITRRGSGDDPDDLDDDELAGLGNLLLIAGHETTSNMLALGTLVLLRQPDQRRLLVEHPENVDAAVEELLRYLSVVHMALPRVATTDVTIGDVTIPRGDAVVVSLPAANRDPELVEHGRDLDLGRAPTNHMAFGHGIHHCLGAPLARAEMQIAFPRLFARFPDLRLALDDDPDFRTETFIYGVRSLPVAWGPIDAADETADTTAEVAR